MRIPKPDWRCQIEGCTSRKQATTTLCWMHWARQHRHGDPTIVKKKIRGICTVEGCGQPHQAKGYCSHHYMRHLAGYPLEPADLRRPYRLCSVGGCDREHAAHGLCMAHDVRRRRGQPVETLKSLKDGHLLKPLHSCVEPDCGREAIYATQCRKHYQREYMKRRKEKTG